MGYVKDNYPGSPASFQRTKVARGVIAYGLVTASLIFAFSPFAIAHREAVKEGAWDNPVWLEEKRIRSHMAPIEPLPTKAEREAGADRADRIRRGDLTGPNLVKGENSPSSSN